MSEFNTPMITVISVNSLNNLGSNELPPIEWNAIGENSLGEVSLD